MGHSLSAALVSTVIVAILLHLGLVAAVLAPLYTFLRRRRRL
jgi:hypothetical protein